jgi:hypothetical protein
MSLKITASEVQIQNAQGDVKFTSSNKLVFPRAYKTGTVTIYNNTVYEPFETLGINEFLQLTFKLISCTGNVGSGILNVEIPANGSVITEFYGRAVNNAAAADTEYIGALLVGNQLVFKTLRIDYNQNIVASTVSTQLTYQARIYSYL